MLALISDIHANLAALEAVLEDIADVGDVEDVYCLGDVVGYGPHPVDCLDLTVEVSKVILLGNHEHAVVHGPYLFNPRARKAIEWTRQQIDSYEEAKKRSLMRLLKSLPERHEIGGVTLVHGSPRDPVMEYVLESDCWEGSDPTKMDEIFADFDQFCFVGHSHRPGVFTEDRCFLPAAELADGFDVSDGRYVINVGSVGQPRDHDPRACYLLFTGDAIYFRRVEYDIDRTASAIRAIPELGNHLAERLYRGQ